MISKRLSLLSSNEEVFNEESAIYNEGLRIAGYKEKVRFIPDQNLQGQRRKRRRNLIHFLPPWNEAVATPICKNLFDLLEKHFKDGTLLGRLFNIKDWVWVCKDIEHEEDYNWSKYEAFEP